MLKRMVNQSVNKDMMLNFLKSQFLKDQVVMHECAKVVTVWLTLVLDISLAVSYVTLTFAKSVTWKMLIDFIIN